MGRAWVRWLLGLAVQTGIGPALAGGYGAFSGRVFGEAGMIGAVASDLVHLFFVTLLGLGIFAFVVYVWMNIGQWALDRWESRNESRRELFTPIDDLLLELDRRGVNSLGELDNENPFKFLEGAPYQREGLARLANDVEGMLIRAGEDPPGDLPLTVETGTLWYQYLLELKVELRGSQRIEPMTRLEAVLLESSNATRKMFAIAVALAQKAVANKNGS